MRQNRYLPRNTVDPNQEQLPLSTTCTILVRQSTIMQAARNINSAEVNPEALITVALQMGFDHDHICLVEDDMGIGAYSTTIEDRPGLKKWLFEDLPRGTSRVVLASHEDRLFRDRDETEHNRFIRECVKYGGWAICGCASPRVYNFRRTFDQDRFRWACKAAKEFIEGHLKARLHPATQRAAMAGRYVGGQVQMGYIVDYDPRSSAYKHLIVYQPHAMLVVDHIFRYFASLPRPSCMEVARHWEREGLFWPCYGPEVDPRVVRAGEAGRKRDDVLGGYRLGWQQAQHILTDVAYLGWRVRAGEIAWDPSANAPRVCHPPLVESDLFWWCFDQIVAERPPWAPPRPAQIHLVTRPRRARADPPGHVRFLAHGRVRCAVHETTFAVRKTGERSWLQCNGNDFRVYRGQGNCPALYTPALEDALCRGFAEQLTLDEQDLQELARILDRRTQVAGGQEQRLRQEIADKKTMYARAVELALRAQNDQLAEDLLEQARQAQQVLAVREVELAHLSAAQPFSAQAWFAAQRAATLAERIRATFAEWSRTAKARVLACALDDAVLGYVDRHLIGLWLRWQGGNQSRFEVPSLFGKHVGWTDEEQQAVRRYYPTLTQDALLQVLPARTWTAIKTFAKRQGIVRPNPGTSLRRCHRLSCRA